MKQLNGATQADSEDILAVKRSCSEASAAAAAASASATVASNAWAANTLAIGTNNTQPGQLGHSADSSEVTRRPQASVRGPEVMQKSMAGAKGAGGAVLCMVGSERLVGTLDVRSGLGRVRHIQEKTRTACAMMAFFSQFWSSCMLWWPSPVR